MSSFLTAFRIPKLTFHSDLRRRAASRRALTHTSNYQCFVCLIVGYAQMGLLAHEIGHALGMRHTQQRSDRDNYVRINWDNLDEDEYYNFQKANTTNFAPYAFSSVMHYGPTVYNTLLNIGPGAILKVGKLPA